MMITHSSPDRTQISLGPCAFPLNCYLVLDEEGYTLIDTGFRLFSGALVKAIRNQGIPLRQIVITHGHFDHTGGIEVIQTAFPEAKLFVGEREHLLMTGDRRTLPGESGGRIIGSFYKLESKPRRLLAAGDRVGSLDVLNAAVQTPGQIALHDGRDVILLAGDAFHTVGGLTPVTQFSHHFPWPYLANWSSATAHATVRWLFSLEISRIAPSQGPVVEVSKAIAENHFLSESQR